MPIPDAPSPDAATAVLKAGERVLAALAADDMDAALDAATDRERLVRRLVGQASPDPDASARFAQQEAALADRLREAHGRIAEALRQLGRVQQAAGKYAAGAPAQARLHARG